MKTLLIVMALSLPQVSIIADAGLQGVFIEWLGCQATIQKTAQHTGALLYTPNKTYPWFVGKSNGSWKVQQSQ